MNRIGNKEKYNIIDMHTHIFPDKIAFKAVKAIGDYYGVGMSKSGTVSNLIESGRSIGVSKFVVHSSATTVEQVCSINKYIYTTQAAHPEFIGFATLHPDMADVACEVKNIIDLGLKGIKLHPEFQNFAIDDESMMPIYKEIEGRLPVLIHMGDKNSDLSSPLRLASVLDRFPDLVVIAAHFGGYQMWELSCEHLIGKRLYMDTSSSLYFISPTRALDMIKRHGVEKMLFGSDFPMWDHQEELQRFLQLELTEEERKAILHDNAQRLLSGEVKKASDI